jgi:RNA polymerase sigma-70 factor (ECF subfamily)
VSDSHAILLEAITANYDKFRSRLAALLGSEDQADEAIQEVYCRLKARENKSQEPICNPASYVLRAAINVATDLRRGEQRRIRQGETLTQLALRNEVDAFAFEQDNRDKIADVKRILAAMPERRRAIFLALRVEGLSQVEIAERFGVSRTTVQTELRLAVEALLDHKGEERNG